MALEPQRALHAVTPTAAPETIRQVGWREVDRAVGMSTKRKYSLFGVGFGPKVPVFETEKVKLPVYQEADRNKRYYAAVKAEDVDRIKREGFTTMQGSKDRGLSSLQMVKQYNAKGQICFFSSEANALNYTRKNIDENYAIVAFVLPEYQEFTSYVSASLDTVETSGAPALQISAQNILAKHIKGIIADPKV
ncbi:MAG: hypothetical protein ACRYG7_50150 [Janthinobacterium lividum]